MMKNIFTYLFVAAAALLLTSCFKDEPDSKSIFDGMEDKEKTEFDLWLDRHYVEPYNINFEYRMPDRETHYAYWVCPPTVEQSVKMAKLIKYVILDGMAELMQDEEDPLLLAKSYFPRTLFLVGSYEIDGTGTVVLASAENGLQINLLGVNFFDFTSQSSCEQFVGTIIHEFAHILDGNIAVPVEFDLVTQFGYIGDQYTSAPADYLQNGFLSNYARSTPAEDIAVMVAALVGNDDAWWESTLSQAGSTGRPLLEKKRDIIVSWLRDDFSIDVYEWHDIYTGRVATIDRIDWESLDD